MSDEVSRRAAASPDEHGRHARGALHLPQRPRLARPAAGSDSRSSKDAAEEECVPMSERRIHALTCEEEDEEEAAADELDGQASVDGDEGELPTTASSDAGAVLVRDYAAPLRRRKPPLSPIKIPVERTVSFHASAQPVSRAAPEVSADADDDDGWDGRSATTAMSSSTSYQASFLPSSLARRENERREAAGRTEQDETLQINTYRRTPLVTGALAPFSIMLEVPGLTGRWYVRTGPDRRPVAYRANPVILDVGLAISITVAVIANLAIVGRFLERLSPGSATALAIVCFCIHDVINIVALTIFGVVHAVDDGFTYAESYWMTAAATVASCLCTISLVWDFVKTKRFRQSGSGLTRKQSRLVLVIMSFLLYLSLSSLFFALAHEPSLPFLDSVYFTILSYATVGLGDILPNTVAAKILLICLAPGGIILLGIVIATARDTMLEEFELSYKRRRLAFKSALAERSAQRREQRRLGRALRKAGRGDARSTTGPKQEQPTSGFAPFRTLSRAFTANSFTLPMTDTEKTVADVLSPSMDPLEEARCASPEQMDSGSASVEVEKLPQEPAPDAEPDTGRTTVEEVAEMEDYLRDRRRQLDENWKDFRRDLELSEKREFWLKLLGSASLFVAFWLVGAGAFSAIEGWSFFDSLYFAFVFSSTIGYGDFAPRTPAGRAFFIVWSLVGIGILTVLFAVLTDAWSNVALRRGRKRSLKPTSFSTTLRSWLKKKRPGGPAPDSADESAPAQAGEAKRSPSPDQRIATDAPDTPGADNGTPASPALSVVGQSTTAPEELPVELARSALTVHRLASHMMRESLRKHLARASPEASASLWNIEGRLRQRRNDHPEGRTRIREDEKAELRQAAEGEGVLEDAVEAFIEVFALEEHLHELLAVASTLGEHLAELHELRRDAAQRDDDAAEPGQDAQGSSSEDAAPLERIGEANAS